MSRRSRGAAAVAWSVLLAVGITSCGDDDPGAAADDSRTTATPSGSAGSSPSSAESAAAYVKLTERTFAEAMTAAMYAQETVHIEMRAGVATIMDADYRFGTSEDVAMEGTVHSGGPPVEMLVVDGAVFVKEGTEPKWTELPAEVAEQVLGEFESADPTQIARTFELGLKQVSYSGVDDVDGLQVHGYDVTLHEEFVAEEMDVPVSEVPDIAYRLWLDEDHLLRRMTFSADGLDAEVLLTRWGTPVGIEAPPEEEVVQPPLS